MNTDCIFVINPGSTSTKIGFVGPDGKILLQLNVTHEGEPRVSMRELLPLRVKHLREMIAPAISDYKPRAVVGRGGPLRPLRAGTYRIGDAMIEDLLSEKYSKHPSNQGAPLARTLAEEWNVPAFVVDPITVDDFADVARVSGFPGIVRRSRSHALNIRSCAHLAAKKIGKGIADARFVIAHLGGGISIAAVIGGKIIDVNDALLGMGPFSPERAGALPLEGLLDLQASGKTSLAELKAELSKNAGLKGYLGTNDLREVEARIGKGDAEADLILRAMIYQTAKEIGACAAALKGRLDAIVLTGGLANSPRLVTSLSEYVAFLGEILVYPGERELEAMAAGAYRILNGEEEPHDY
ncbi:MAG: butyrate kinase [bacterium]|nr:butyrate kinase [bacterium]